MTFGCAQLEDALRSEDPEQLQAAAAHAEGCPACREALRLWNELSSVAKSLHREWESPELWPRIRAAVAAEPRVLRPRWPVAVAKLTREWRSLAAAAVLSALAAAGAWVFLRSLEWRHTAEDREQTERLLLTERALGDVERSEAEYVRSIESLSKLASPGLETPRSPLLASYHEKLMLIDAAIAECRTQIQRNRFNAHLRRELLSIYQEKQRTLEQILEEEKHAL